MNRTQLLSLGSALGLTLKKSSPPAAPPPEQPTASAPVDVKGNHNKHGNKSANLEDEIGPLTASPPVSPATRMSSSSASFFPSTNNNSRHNAPTNGDNAKQLPLKDFGRIGSFGTHALPKLRESKWFNESEARIFCVVAEIGFIVEIRRAVDQPQQQHQGKDTKEYKSLFGVVTKKECINQSAEGVCELLVWCNVLCVCLIFFTCKSSW